VRAARAGRTSTNRDGSSYEYEQKWNQLFAVKLEEFGEREMADLFREDPEAFQRRSDLGQRFFHGAEAWLDGLVEGVAGCMTANSPIGPLGYRYGEEEGIWEVDVYPTPVELVGGASDGEIVAPGFSLDLETLRELFDRVDNFGWQSAGFPRGDGPFVEIEGVYRGGTVFVQVFASAPEDEEPGMRLDTR
jgi:hypothetical protein